MFLTAFRAACARLLPTAADRAGPARTQFWSTALMVLALSALGAPVSAQLTLGPQLVAMPANGTALGTVSVSGDRLTVGADYRVVLVVTAGDRRTLATVLDGDGEFTRIVTIPSIATGQYTMELTVNNTLRDSVSFRVLPPLVITLTPASPRAGTTVNFSVSGLTAGSLSLSYAGRTSFGPVNVSGGTYNGRMRIPTDRPSSLPADVVLTAANGAGRIQSRRGSRTVRVLPANTRPFARVLNATPSNTTPAPRQRFRISGNVETNEAAATDVTVEHFWVGSNGSTIPMGASFGSVSGGGAFEYEMLTPQHGTNSAARVGGAGRIATVTRYTDASGFVHQERELGPAMSTAELDTDVAVDINITLNKAGGGPVEDARIELKNKPWGAQVPAESGDLEDLYPPNDNAASFSLNGSHATLTTTQFEDFISDETLGCPANLTRQFTDSQGRAAFEFALALSPTGTSVDGSVTFPVQATIPPDSFCNSGGSINDSSRCTVVDPAGIYFDVVIRAAHTGYGYFSGGTFPAEIPVIIATRIDRYNGQIRMSIQRPGAAPEVRLFNRSANLALTLPDLPGDGLLLGDPYFVTTTGDVEGPIQVESASGSKVRLKSIMDLTPFRTSATFVPAGIPVRQVEFRYNRGAGEPLQNALFIMPGRNGTTPIVMSRVTGGSASCTDNDTTEVWRANLSSEQNEGLRFPGSVYNSTGLPLVAQKKVEGRIQAFDALGRQGIRKFEFTFEPLEGWTAQGGGGAPLGSLARLAHAAPPGLTIHTSMPHARRLAFSPALGCPQGANPNDCPVAVSDAAPSQYENMGSKRSEVAGAATYDLCIPTSESICGGATTAIGFSHQQYNRQPAAQPAALSSFGAADIAFPANGAATWEELFKVTVPLFRWVWGVPGLFGASVFADLAVKAEYLLDALFDANNPMATKVDSGGRMGLSIYFGVDVDVLFGVLMDVGAMLHGAVTAEVVTESTLQTVEHHPCLTFTLGFTGWLEIGCPIDVPIDPTCYIPNIEESFTILEDRNPSGCGFREYRAASAALGAADSKTLLDWQMIPAGPLATSGLASADSTSPPAPTGGDVEPVPFTREMRRALHRSPTLAFDGTGNSLVLNLDPRGHLVARENLFRNNSPPPAQTLSTGFGIRDVALTYFSADRAVAVWAESTLAPVMGSPPQLTRDSAAAAQSLLYAVFDGDAWGTKRRLTTPGFGEGQVKLARCRASPFALRTGCVEKASLVFQRNTQATVGGHKHIFFAQFDGLRWTAPMQVSESGNYNITPSLAYASGEPVVVWVRYLPGCGTSALRLGDTQCRQLALRVMDGRGREQTAVGGSERGVAQPSIAGKLNGQIAIAYTKADNGVFVGSRQALQLGERPCGITATCAFTTWEAQDHRGRRIYVERPKVNINGAGDAIVSFRGLAYGPVPGASNPEANLFDDDPIGIRTSTGALMDLVTPLQPSFLRPRDLTATAGVHFQPFAAFDAVTQENVAVSVTIQTPQLRAAAERAGEAGRAAAQTAQVEDGISVAMIGDAADLFVETLSTTATQLNPGTNIPVRIEIANRGSAWTTSAEQTATVRLWWDIPQTRTVTSASFAVGNIAAGAKLVRNLQVPVPASFANDQRQMLRAAIEVDSETGEIDGDNNEATVAVGGMPIPTPVMALSAAGTRFVNLVWDAPTDARIAGYRIWFDDAEGTPQPLGSSFNKGWVDLTALFGFKRVYRVSTYSANGIESALSEPVIAEPAKAQIEEDIFASGFE